jgi:hypothetical protein
MKKGIIFILSAIFALSISVSAQEDRYASSRLNNLSNQLKRQTVDLADRTSDSISRGYSSRSDIEAAFTATQIDASAGLFQQMVSNNSNANQLRDAASILSDIARRSPSSGSNSSYWRDIQRSIDDINREIGGNTNGGGWGNGNGNGNGGGWGNNNGNGNINNALGKARWTGTVDKEVHLLLHNNNIETRLFDGQDYGAGTYNMTSAMPNSNVQVYVNKKKGRGDVIVIQQPERSNNFTTIVKILDSGSGAKEYDVEIYWTR